MTLKRTIVYISLLLILCLAPSCIYLRLLKFKNQMADFDRCFQVKEEKGLKIICLKPVLYNDDIGKMLNPPTLSNKTKQPARMDEAIRSGGNEQWTYVFEKKYPDNHKSDEDNFDISLDMVFKDDLLNEIHLPERFLVILPKTFLITIFKAMGNAQINKKEYSAKGTYPPELSSGRAGEPKEKNQIQVPRQDDVLKFLGNPFVWREDDANVKLFYEYRLKQKTTKPDNPAPCVWIEFTFQKTDGTLLKAEGNLCGMELSLNFVPDPLRDKSQESSPVRDNKKDDKKPDNK